MTEQKLGSAPRDVVLNFGGRFAVGAMALVALGGSVGGALLYQSAVREASHASLIAQGGMRTTGQIDKIGPADDQNYERKIDFHFEVEGVNHHGSSRMRGKDADSFTSGAAAQVEYLPQDPSVAWISGHPPTSSPPWIGPFVALTALVPVIGLFYHLRCEHSLLTNGRVAEGAVIKSKRFSVPRAQGGRVTYEFSDLNGRIWKGSDERKRRAWSAGAKITVLYDRDNPKQSAPYPMKFFKVRVS